MTQNDQSEWILVIDIGTEHWCLSSVFCPLPNWSPCLQSPLLQSIIHTVFTVVSLQHKVDHLTTFLQ